MSLLRNKKDPLAKGFMIIHNVEISYPGTNHKVTFDLNLLKSLVCGQLHFKAHDAWIGPENGFLPFYYPGKFTPKGERVYVGEGKDKADCKYIVCHNKQLWAYLETVLDCVVVTNSPTNQMPALLPRGFKTNRLVVALDDPTRPYDVVSTDGMYRYHMITNLKHPHTKEPGMLLRIDKETGKTSNMGFEDVWEVRFAAAGDMAVTLGSLFNYGMGNERKETTHHVWTGVVQPVAGGSRQVAYVVTDMAAFKMNPDKDPHAPFFFKGKHGQ